MARIPPSLQAKKIVKPPTVAQMQQQKIGLPVRQRTLTPQQQQQLDTYNKQIEKQQKTISQLERDIQKEIETQKLREQERVDLLAQNPSREDRARINRGTQERVETSKSIQRALQQALNLAKAGYDISYQAAQTFVAQTERYEHRELKESLKPTAEPLIVEQVKVDIPTQPSKVPTRQVSRVIVGYDFIGRPLYQSVARELTPTESAFTKLGLAVPPKPKPKLDFETFERPFGSERGTIPDQPITTFLPTDMGEPQSFLEFTQKGVQFVGGVSDLPTRERQHKQGEIFSLVPETGVTPRRETVTYVPPTLPAGAELEKQRILEEAIGKTQIGDEAKMGIENIYNKYVNQLGENPTIPQIEQARKLAKKEADDFFAKLNKKYEDEYTERERERVDKYVKTEFSEKFWARRISNLLRLGLYSIPYFGQTLLVSDVAELGLKRGEVFSYARQYPGLFAKETVATIATFGIGGAGVGRIKGSIKQQKIMEAIDSSRVLIKSKGVLTESEINALKISAEQKLMVKNLLREGGSLKKYDTELKYPEKTKYTPEVKGEFIEVTNSAGDIIIRVALGELKAKLGKKKINKIAIEEAMLKINRETGGVEGYGELVITKQPQTAIDLVGGGLTGKYKKTKFSEAVKYKFYEKGKLVLEKKTPRERRTVTEAEVRLLGKERFRGDPLLKEYGFREPGLFISPDYAALSKLGKPYSKSRFAETAKLKKAKVEITTGKPVSLIKVSKEFRTTGLGVAERIKTPVKKIRPSKGFKEEILPEPIVKQKASKSFRGKTEEYTISQPSYVGGAGGEAALSLYAGKQYKVPAGTPSGGFITSTFASQLPLGLTGFSGFKGFVTGVGLGLGVGVKTGLSPKQEQRVITTEIEKTKLSGSNLPLFAQSPTEITQEEIRAVEKVSFIHPQKLSQKQKQKTTQQIISTTKTPTPLAIRFPGEKFDFKFGFEVPEVEKRKQEPRIGYNAYGMKGATTRGRKWVKLNTQPASKELAKDIGARAVDKSISAKFKIEAIKQIRKIKGKPKQVPKVFKKPLPPSNDYFKMNANKFRDYRIKDGQRKPMVNKWIEKRRFRADSRGETQKLQLEKKRKRRTFFGF